MQSMTNRKGKNQTSSAVSKKLTLNRNLSKTKTKNYQQTVKENCQITNENSQQKTQENQQKRRIINEVPILESQRKTAYIGFIISMKSALRLAKRMFVKGFNYFLTYKLSQDHIETFFSCIRRMGVFINNPTTRQFTHALKKIVTHVHGLASPSANCIAQDATKIIRITSSDLEVSVETSNLVEELDNYIEESDSDSNNQQNKNNVIYFDHDYDVDCNFWSDYKENIIPYIAGSIVRGLKSKYTKQHISHQYLYPLKGEDCPSFLQIRKDRGIEKSYLTTASNDVIKICKVAEETIMRKENILKVHGGVEQLSLEVKQNLPLDLFVDLSSDEGKKLGKRFIDDITKKYLKIRFYHEVKKLSNKVKRLRTFLHRTVIFKNQ